MQPAPRSLVFAGLAVFACCAGAPAFAQQAPVPGTGANYETRLESIEDQMRTLDGRIEQLEFSVKRLDQTVQRMQTDTDERLSKLESAPVSVTQAAAPAAPPPPSVSASATQPPAAAQEEDSDDQDDQQPAASAAPVNGSLGAIKMQDGKVTGAVNNPQAPPLPAATPDYTLTPQEQYDRAFDLIRKTDYEQAGDAFKAFIEKNPKDKLVADAKYWYGETLYVRNQFDQAAVAFADAWQQNPKSARAADSLLKLALSLEKLDKTADACATLDSLKLKYPTASINIRATADREHAKLKCGSGATPAAAH